MDPVSDARERYLRLALHERTHADYCKRGPERRCFARFALDIQAASLALDMAIAEQRAVRAPAGAERAA
jgi:hypothetical protein